MDNSENSKNTCWMWVESSTDWFWLLATDSVTPSSTHRVGLCSEKDVEMILNLLKEESRMIISLIKKLEN